MRYCKKCVQPDTRPSIYFSEQGICGACLYEEEKKEINWIKRERDLREITELAKKQAIERRCNYDCVIGVSGGKDSTFQSVYARDKLGLRPLLVNGEPDGITEVGRKNIENLKNLGFDVISLRPNPQVMKRLVKKDFYEFLNPVKVTEFSLWASAYIIADKFNIPLIVQGENDALTLGVRNTDVGVGDDALNADKQNTLSSGWERYIANGVSERDLFMFHYNRENIRAQGIRGIWLQYYTKEWSGVGNTEFAVSRGLQGRPGHDPQLTGRLNPYSSVDSDMQIPNQMLKYYKFGFGCVTDQTCYSIRHGSLSRDEAIKLVEQYDGKCGQRYIDEFCAYIDITVEEFWHVVDRFVNKNLFRKDPTSGKWTPLFKVGYDFVSE